MRLLDYWGNKAEIINGLVGMAGNVIGAAGEVLGAGDAVQTIGLGLDYAAGAGLDAADSAEADIRFAQTVIGAENLKNEVVRSIRGFAATHPNTAEGIKAVVNAAAGYGAAKGIGAAKAGKAAVSDNFADAAQTKYYQYGEAHSANAKEALNRKLSILESAPKKAASIRTLADGRIRYYEKERPAGTQGNTRGNAMVTEYNPKNGSVRTWAENRDYSGNVTQVHPKTKNGQVLTAQHYPPTKSERKSWKK